MAAGRRTISTSRNGSKRRDAGRPGPTRTQLAIASYSTSRRKERFGPAFGRTWNYIFTYLSSPSELLYHRVHWLFPIRPKEAERSDWDAFMICFPYSSDIGWISFSYTSDIGRHDPGRGVLTCVYTIEQISDIKRRVCSSSKLDKQKGRYCRFARHKLVKYEPSRLVEHQLCSIVKTHLKKEANRRTRDIHNRLILAQIFRDCHFHKLSCVDVDFF
jgi:hypothetical protein